MAKRVELRCATLPFIGAFAEHYWFVVFDEEKGECERWEVWQLPDAGGTSFGHVHCDLKHPDAGVGGGPARIITEWKGDDASRISKVLAKIEEDYPHIDLYRPWPGPNSNTFVAWVLRQAGVDYPLPWKAIGKDFA
jgi:hypothetical protein